MKAKPYPLNKKLVRAVDHLFPDEETGKIAIGAVGFPLECRKQMPDPETPYEDRIMELKDFLEDFVDLNARQLDEFEGEYDVNRLRFEARGFLLSLRELHRLFPEVIK